MLIISSCLLQVCVIYAKRNLTESGGQLCDTMIRALAKFAETTVFVLIGYGFWLYLVGKKSFADRNITIIEPPCVSTSAQQMEPSFVVLTLSLCLLARACSTFPMAALANCCRTKSRRIRLHEQAVIWFSGLRGAIALALAVEFPTADHVRGTSGQGSFCNQREKVVACTIIVILVTVFLMGGLTKPMLNLCGISMNSERLDDRPRPVGTSFLSDQISNKPALSASLLRYFHFLRRCRRGEQAKVETRHHMGRSQGYTSCIDRKLPVSHITQYARN